MSGKAIVIPDDIYARAEQAAASAGTTVEALTREALERDLARRWLERVGQEGEHRRATMTDDEIEALIAEAVRESRESS